MNSLPHLAEAISRHLTAEQIFDLLEQPNRPGALRLHLAACPDCRAEVSSLRASLANFREAATSLASTPLPSPRQPVAQRRSPYFRRQVWAGSLTAAAALIAVSISLTRPRPVTPVSPAPPTTAATIFASESDEALLDGIQRDLSTSIPPSLEPLAVPASTSDMTTQN